MESKILNAGVLTPENKAAIAASRLLRRTILGTAGAI